MPRTDGDPWVNFRRWMEEIAKELPGHAPVALILLPATRDGAATELSLDGPDVMVWPAEVPQAVRRLVLGRLGKSYADRNVYDRRGGRRDG